MSPPRWEPDPYFDVNYHVRTVRVPGAGTMRDFLDMAAPVAKAVRVPQAEIYAIDVSFAALADKTEFAYLNQQPTSFVLPPEAVDRLRAAAGTIIATSPEFQRLLNDLDAKIVADPKQSGTDTMASTTR